jgi:hypothetical protein
MTFAPRIVAESILIVANGSVAVQLDDFRHPLHPDLIRWDDVEFDKLVFRVRLILQHDPDAILTRRAGRAVRSQ